MCIICVDFQKQLLTPTEARRNMGEMVIDKAHKLEILLMLEDAELIKKISDAPARYAFNIDVGNVPDGKVENFLREAKRQLQDKKLRNPLEDEDDSNH